MKSSNCEVVDLDNGMRVLVAHRPGQVVYCGIAVAAGTRDQLDTESGMAHLVEHMSFKGTERRSSWHILNRMERVGGDLNAFTAKEHTVYYCSCLRSHFRRAIDLLLDITLHSTFPQPHLEREVEVVCDEIESYNDSPSELIFDDYEALLFQNHPLGRNILGDAEHLRQYHSEDLLAFTHRLYDPSRMVLFVLGDVRMTDVIGGKGQEVIRGKGQEVRGKSNVSDLQNSSQEAKVSSYLLPPTSYLPKELPPTSYLPKVQCKDKHTHQAHVIMGCHAYPLGDARCIPLRLLSNILGGPGMNSLLNVSLRERRGLVYTVETVLAHYTDAGVWTTYFGCAPSDVERCRRLVVREIQRMLDAPLTPSQLQSAKRQFKGQLALSWENGENVAIGLGTRLLHNQPPKTLEQMQADIDSLTATQLWDTAQEVLQPERLTTLIYK